MTALAVLFLPDTPSGYNFRRLGASRLCITPTVYSEGINSKQHRQYQQYGSHDFYGIQSKSDLAPWPMIKVIGKGDGYQARGALCRKLFRMKNFSETTQKNKQLTPAIAPDR